MSTTSSIPSSATIHAGLRLATPADVPNIHRLIHQMAVFEKLAHLFSATPSSLSSTLFPPSPPPPFTSVTALILELSPSPFPPSYLSTSEIRLQSPVADAESETFRSPSGDGSVVAGYVLCFPNYPSFLGRPGLFVEDIFVREAWRRKGLGRMMLSAVAGQAAKLGYGRVEWTVLNWNENAIQFYKEMGAEVLPMWSICRLSGLVLFSVQMTSSSIASSRPPVVECYCKPPAVMGRSGTRANSRRLFWTCPNWRVEDHSCKFFFLDDKLDSAYLSRRCYVDAGGRYDYPPVEGFDVRREKIEREILLGLIIGLVLGFFLGFFLGRLSAHYVIF